MKKNFITLLIIVLAFVVLIGWASWQQVKESEVETGASDKWTHCHSVALNHSIQCWTPDGWVSLSYQQEPSLVALDFLGIDGSWSVIDGELNISGRLTGLWFFEADCQAEVYDYHGRKITQAIATATGEWMTEELVNFQATFSWPDGLEIEKAILVLIKDNPTGDPEHDDALVLPIRLSYSSDRE